MRESFCNTLYVAAVSVVVASLIAVPLAYLTVRFQFRGALLIQTLGVLPLIMPPFVGAVAMQLIFGRSGSVNLLLNDIFGFRIPFMEGLNGVIFVESLHYFPFILLNLIVCAAQHRRRDGGIGAEPRRRAGGCSAASCSRSRCPATSPARRWSSSRCSTTSARRWCSAQTNMLAPQAYLRITRSASRIRSAT